MPSVPRPEPGAKRGPLSLPLRFPLGLRVIVLVTVFNVAVFSGGLVWVTGQLARERKANAGVGGELVLERLRNLLDVEGLLSGEILRWTRWDRYDDAMIVQLRELEPRAGLLLDMRQVALEGRPRLVPSGVAMPLRRPPPRRRRAYVLPPGNWTFRSRAWEPGVPRVALVALASIASASSAPLHLHVWRTRDGDLPHLVLPDASMLGFVPAINAARHSIVLPRLAPGEPWGACLLRETPLRFGSWARIYGRERVWDLGRAGGPYEHPVRAVLGLLGVLGTWAEGLADATYLGLPNRPLRGFDTSTSDFLTEALRIARDDGTLGSFRGGVLLPMTRREGGVWGAGFFPFSTWYALVPGPWFAPPRWLSGALFDALPEYDVAPVLDIAGIFLNPMGSSRRPPAWDRAAVLEDIRLAATEGQSVENERGLAVPLRLASGELWGGCWLKPKLDGGALALLRELTPWFLLSTLFLTLATFFGMQRLVLDPVRRLARGAGRLSRGDLSARIREDRRRDELADLVRSFNTMAGQVEGFNARLAREVEVATAAARDAEAAAMTQRRLAATGELAAGIAHEINNPLGGMLNALEVLQREQLAPEKREQYLELLHGGLERIRQTVGQVLRLAPRETRTELVSLADPIGDAIGLVRHRAAKQGTALLVEGEGGERDVDAPHALEPWRRLPPVRGQSNELGQAVLNLLVNALDALEELQNTGDREPTDGGSVRIGLASGAADAPEPELHLWIVDDGPGMPPELLERAADLFFTTKVTGKGTGLGLTIAHNVVHGHGGRVQMSSPDGGGFRVDIWLPCAKTDGRHGGAA